MMKIFYFVLIVCLLLPCRNVFAQASLAVAMYQKGHALLDSNDNNRALAFLEDATTQDSTMVKAWLDLGRCRLKLGKPDGAVYALNKTVELEPDLADAHYYLGEAYSMLSQYPQAIEEYKQSVKIEPRLADAYFGLGIADIAIGDRDAAQKELLHLQVMDIGDNQSLLHMSYGVLKEEYTVILQFLGQPGHKLPPVDEAAKDPSFVAFRQRLILAIKNHDSKYILSITDPEISLSGGRINGIDDFKKFWSVTTPDGPFWITISRILSIGSGRVPSHEKNAIAFQVPYAFKKFPYHTERYTDFGIVTKHNANLYSAPSVNSHVLKMLSYNVVIPLYSTSVFRGAGLDSVFNWARVVTASGDVGYLNADEFWTEDNIYALFVKRNGRWMMTSFWPGEDYKLVQ